MHSFELSPQKGNPPPREKIKGSQHIRREEKTKPKLTIRNPFLPKERRKVPTSK